MSTPHNQAEKGQFAKTVLMPGDPLRAKFVADTFLEDVQQVTGVRAMLGFTGTYKGKRVSVMGSGMGMPSIGIYSYELFHDYDVDHIIRIGSAGAYTDTVKLYDVVMATESYSESTFALQQNGDTANVMLPGEALCEKLERSAAALGLPLVKGPIHSSDVFYSQPGVFDFDRVYREHGCLCVEMESFALFHNARVLGKNAACLLTVSDSLVTHEAASVEERQKSFTNMMEIALNTL